MNWKSCANYIRDHERGKFVHLPIRDAIKSLIRRCGFSLTRISGMPFGHHVWTDIERLCEGWGSTISCTFDVGANIGQTSLEILAHFPNAKVYSFEPHPDTFSKLSRTLQNRRAHVVNIALSNRSGTADLFTYESNLISSLSTKAPYAIRFNRQSTKSVSTRVLTLDEFCSSQDIDEIDILKIDTEGCDLDVCRGAAGKLKARQVKFIYTEFNTIFGQADRNDGALVPICEFLTPYGFEFVTVYTDYIVTDGNFFAVHNALFALPP